MRKYGVDDYRLVSGIQAGNMEESCKEKTTFICEYGTYQFEVMPFELMNSGATFQKMRDNILAYVISVKCYVSDVAVQSVTK